MRTQRRTALVDDGSLVSAAVDRRRPAQQVIGANRRCASARQRALTANFSIVLAYNSGAAFSFLADASGWQRYLFTALATRCLGV